MDDWLGVAAIIVVCGGVGALITTILRLAHEPVREYSGKP